MVSAQLDVEGREVPAEAVAAPLLPSIPAPKPASTPAPMPELVGQRGCTS